MTVINEKVVSILKDKINVVKNDDHFIYIVGPITLPVNLDGETQVFSWYSWLRSDNVKEGALSTEQLIEKMQGSNLADLQ